VFVVAGIHEVSMLNWDATWCIDEV